MLSQTTQYAVAALIHLAQQAEDDYHQTHEVARQIRVPANYLGKILQKLAHRQIVESQKGLHGGFRIARLPEQIRLYDILGAMDTHRPALERADGSDNLALPALHRQVASIDRLYLKFLKETTLADVMAAETSTRPATPATGPATQLVNA